MNRLGFGVVFSVTRPTRSLRAAPGPDPGLRPFLAEDPPRGSPLLEPRPMKPTTSLEATAPARVPWTQSHAVLIVTGGAWTLFVGAWLFALFTYESTPADASAPTVVAWPAETSISRNANGPTLLVFLHPKCPCSRATVEELSRALVSRPDDLSCQVLAFHPAAAPDGWVEGDLWRTARSLPEVETHTDPGGVEARRFGATTSGTVLLFDRDGNLKYEGGLTASRGHAGHNRGRQALVDSFRGLAPSIGSFPVFGCPISSPEACPNPQSCPRER